MERKYIYLFEIKESTELVFDLGEDLSICPRDSVLLVSPLGEELLWNGMILSEEIWIHEEGIVTAEYNGTCFEDCIADQVYIPNIFTPNGE